MAAGASAATVRVAITGSYIVAPVPTDTNPIAVDATLSGVAGDLLYTGIGSSAGSLTVNVPVFPFADATGPGAGLTEFHGDVSQGCVRLEGNHAVVIGHLPADEQFDIPFGHMEWVGTHLEDNGVGSAVDRGRVFFSRTMSGNNHCNPALPFPSVAPVEPLSTGDGSIGYTDQLDGYPANPDTTAFVVNPNGLAVTITDALPDPDGLQVATGSGGGPAELRTCGVGQTFVAANSTVIVTCGSLILEVVTGSAEVVLEDGLAVVSIPEGGVAEITEEPDGSFTVENQGTTPIEVTVDGETDTIEPGETDTVEAWDFQGFGLASPPALNKANAGSSVALKWRIVDAAGAPVTDLSTAAITVTNVDCTTGADLGNAQPGQTAGSLQNRGGGNYQLNWKTQKSWAGTCRAMHLDIGDGVTHDAYFKFR